MSWFTAMCTAAGKRAAQNCTAIFYILQNMHYVETGAFCRTKAEPLAQLRGEDREIPALAMHWEKEYAFDNAFAKVFGWCARALHRL